MGYVLRRYAFFFPFRGMAIYLLLLTAIVCADDVEQKLFIGSLRGGPRHNETIKKPSDSEEVPSHLRNLDEMELNVRLFLEAVFEKKEQMDHEIKKSAGAEATALLETLDVTTYPSATIDLIDLLARLRYQPAEQYLLKILNNQNLSESEDIEVRVKAASALAQFGSDTAFQDAVHYLYIVYEWYILHSNTMSNLPHYMSEAVAWASRDDRMISVALECICRGTGHDRIVTSILYTNMKKGVYRQAQIQMIVDGVWDALWRCLLPDTLLDGTLWAFRILIENWNILDDTQKVAIEIEVDRLHAYWATALESFGQNSGRYLLEQHQNNVDTLREIKKEIAAKKDNDKQ